MKFRQNLNTPAIPVEIKYDMGKGQVIFVIRAVGDDGGDYGRLIMSATEAREQAMYLSTFAELSEGK